jgi:ABC-type transport system substrate-binding protein
MKKNIKKVLSLGLALSMLIGVTACGSSTGDSTTGASGNSAAGNSTEAGSTESAGTTLQGADNAGAVNGGGTSESVQRSEINVGINADPGNLSPWSAENTGRTAVANCIYQSLAHIIDGEIVGVLMKDYQLAEDESYMDVTLYDYIYDAAGEHITARDVKFSFDECIAEGNIYGLGFIDSCEVVNDYTARFTFNDVLYVYDLETLFETFYIVSEASYNATGDGMATDPITTGAYQVSEYTAGYAVKCVKNESYWQKDETLIADRDKTNVDAINYYILTESTQMSTALQTGSIDMSWAVNAEDLSTFASDGNYWIYQAPDNLVAELWLNCDENHATSDVNLRKAIYYAINSEMIMASAFNGNGIAISDTAAAKAPDYNTAWDNEDNYYNYDLDKANEYLEAWGGDVSSLNLNILVANDEEMSNSAQIIQGFLSQIGIASTITCVDSATLSTYQADPTQWDVLFNKKATGNYCTTSWKNCFAENFFTWGGTINFVYDDELQQLLNTARLLSTNTPEAVDAVHEYIVDNAYGYGVLDTVDSYVVTNDISNIVTSYKGAVLPGGCTYTE